MFMKCIETHKFLVPAVRKMRFLEKPSSLVHFFYPFSIAWMFGIINQFIQKTQSLQILICRLLQAKHLVITQERDDGVKMVLSYRLQQNVGVELHMI